LGSCAPVGPLKGKKLPTLAEIAKTAVFQAVTITGPDGRTRTSHIHEFVCLWTHALLHAPGQGDPDPQRRQQEGLRRRAGQQRR
jgi:hypothetical protein